MGGIYHAVDGLCFERVGESVRVALLRAVDGLEPGGGLTLATLPLWTFASAVASVSSRGETAETYHEALKLLGE